MVGVPKVKVRYRRLKFKKKKKNGRKREVKDWGNIGEGEKKVFNKNVAVVLLRIITTLLSVGGGGKKEGKKGIKRLNGGEGLVTGEGRR